MWRSPMEKARREEGSPEGEHSQGSRVVFDIKGNDYRLIAVVQYAPGVLMLRFFRSHEDYLRSSEIAA